MTVAKVSELSVDLVANVAAETAPSMHSGRRSLGRTRRKAASLFLERDPVTFTTYEIAR
jgi:hypothetical protein